MTTLNVNEIMTSLQRVPLVRSVSEPMKSFKSKMEGGSDGVRPRPRTPVLCVRMFCNNEEVSSTIPKAPPIELRKCGICLYDQPVNRVVSLCASDECASFCLECVKKYIVSLVDGMFGAVSMMKCPGGCGSRLLMKQWQPYVEPGVYQQFFNKAQHQLLLQCGSCHVQSTTMPVKPSDPVIPSEDLRYLLMGGDNVKKNWEEFWEIFEQYSSGSLNAERMLSALEDFVFPEDYASVRKERIARAQQEHTSASNDFDHFVRTDEQLQTWRMKLNSYRQKMTEVTSGSRMDFLNLIKSFRHLSVDQRVVAARNYSKQQRQEAITDGDSINYQTLNHMVEELTEAIEQRENERRRELQVDAKLAAIEAAKAALELEDYRHECMRHVMHLLRHDVERQVSLYLRYLVKYPTIKSLCCKYKHCFRCKIKQGHPGKTCEEYQHSFVQEVRFCTQCGCALVKGDGCNSIKCICGTGLSWSTLPKYEQQEQQQIILEAEEEDDTDISDDDLGLFE